jgi:hypothetical protein
MCAPPREFCARAVPADAESTMPMLTNSNDLPIHESLPVPRFFSVGRLNAWERYQLAGMCESWGT